MALTALLALAQQAPAANVGYVYDTGYTKQGRIDGVAGMTAFLEGLGHTVTVIDVFAAGSADLSAIDVVLVDEGVSSGDIGAQLVDATVPIISFEAFHLDEMNMAADDHEFNTGADSMVVTADGAANPIMVAAGISAGAIVLYDGVTGLVNGSNGAAPSAVILATTGTETDSAAVFYYEAGDTMANDFTAPARRMYLPFGNDDGEVGLLSADGQAIMTASIDWALGLIDTDVEDWDVY